MKLAIIAKEGISIDILRRAHPDKVIFPPEPICKEDVDNKMAQKEKERRIRNEQLKNAFGNIHYYHLISTFTPF